MQEAVPPSAPDAAAPGLPLFRPEAWVEWLRALFSPGAEPIRLMVEATVMLWPFWLACLAVWVARVARERLWDWMRHGRAPSAPADGPADPETRLARLERAVQAIHAEIGELNQHTGRLMGDGPLADRVGDLEERVEEMARRLPAPRRPRSP